MNKNIENLIKESYIGVITTKGMENIKDGAYIVSPEKLEFYTNLVVKKCLELAQEQHKLSLETNDYCEDTGNSIIDSIEKYFGV